MICFFQKNHKKTSQTIENKYDQKYKIQKSKPLIKCVMVITKIKVSNENYKF